MREHDTVVRARGRPLISAPLDELELSVRTGERAFEKVFGLAPFDYLAKHPDEARQFRETMVGFHGVEPPAELIRRHARAPQK